jgi:hypothetical protein
MTRKAIFAAVIVTAIIALAGLLSFAAHPLLYSQANETPETEFHINPDILVFGQVNSTTDVYPLMQDLLDSPGDIVLNVRLNDIDSAQADLAAYRKTYGNLNHLVIRLDMNQSEIDTFARSTAVQDQIFQQLMNETATLDALQQLEIQYQDSNDPEMVTSVKYQGATLRKRIHELYDRYSKENTTVTSIATKHGLDTTGYTKSVMEFKKIVSQADTIVDIPAPARAFNSSTPFLTLAIYPRQAVYRDTILVLGYLNAPDLNTPVTVLSDGTPLIHVTPDETGEYRGSFTVERIPAGSHNISARTASLSSPPVYLTVSPVNSTTTLSARPVPGRMAARCTGTVIANHPVRSAPFTITEKGELLIRGMTDGAGAFNATIPLAAGTHIIQAHFSSPDYPVNASESTPVSLTIPPLPANSSPEERGDFWKTIVTGAAIIGILAASGGGAFWYLGRKKRSVTPVEEPAGFVETSRIPRQEPRTPQESTRIDRAILTALKQDALFARFRNLLRSYGLSEAAHLIYLILASRIAVRLRIDRYRTLTPRELGQICEGERYGKSLRSFIVVYEKIRFAGSTGRQAQSDLEATMVKTDRETRGDRH